MKDKELREILGVESIDNHKWKEKDHKYYHLRSLEDYLADTGVWHLGGRVSRLESDLKDAYLRIKELEWRIRAVEG